MFNSAESISKRSKENLAGANNTNFIIFAFCLVFYGRIFITLTSAPSILIHAHFVIVPLVLGIALATATAKNPQQTILVRSLLWGMLIFLVTILVSAIWNRAGFINAIVSFMMLGEPMMFLVAIVCIPMSARFFFFF